MVALLVKCQARPEKEEIEREVAESLPHIRLYVTCRHNERPEKVKYREPEILPLEYMRG